MAGSNQIWTLAGLAAGTFVVATCANLTAQSLVHYDSAKRINAIGYATAGIVVTILLYTTFKKKPSV